MNRAVEWFRPGIFPPDRLGSNEAVFSPMGPVHNTENFSGTAGLESLFGEDDDRPARHLRVRRYARIYGYSQPYDYPQQAQRGGWSRRDILPIDLFQYKNGVYIQMDL